jgi:peroxiredoxin
LAAFEAHKDTFADLGVKIFAASVDTGDDSKAVADEVSFAVGEGVTRDQAEQIGAWYGDARHPEMIQPSEFMLKQDGTVQMSSYSSGPLARIDAEDVIKVVNFLDNLAKG